MRSRPKPPIQAFADSYHCLLCPHRITTRGDHVLPLDSPVQRTHKRTAPRHAPSPRQDCGMPVALHSGRRRRVPVHPSSEYTHGNHGRHWGSREERNLNQGRTRARDEP